MTRNAAFELGSKGVRVNIFALGSMLTSLTQRLNAGQALRHNDGGSTLW